MTLAELTERRLAEHWYFGRPEYRLLRQRLATNAVRVEATAQSSDEVYLEAVSPVIGMFARLLLSWVLRSIYREWRKRHRCR